MTISCLPAPVAAAGPRPTRLLTGVTAVALAALCSSAWAQTAPEAKNPPAQEAPAEKPHAARRIESARSEISLQSTDTADLSEASVMTQPSSPAGPATRVEGMSRDVRRMQTATTPVRTDATQPVPKTTADSGNRPLPGLSPEPARVPGLQSPSQE